jgi:hypothetical protein
MFLSQLGLKVARVIRPLHEKAEIILAFSVLVEIYNVFMLEKVGYGTFSSGLVDQLFVAEFLLLDGFLDQGFSGFVGFDDIYDRA